MGLRASKLVLCSDGHRCFSQEGTAMIPGTTLALDPASADPALAEFDLQVTVTTDAAVGYTVRRCDTSDTCVATCASACVSS
jgi:FxLD family lantipeptide